MIARKVFTEKVQCVRPLRERPAVDRREPRSGECEAAVSCAIRQNIAVRAGHRTVEASPEGGEPRRIGRTARNCGIEREPVGAADTRVLSERCCKRWLRPIECEGHITIGHIPSRIDRP